MITVHDLPDGSDDVLHRDAFYWMRWADILHDRVMALRDILVHLLGVLSAAGGRGALGSVIFRCFSVMFRCFFRVCFACVFVSFFSCSLVFWSVILGSTVKGE